MTIERVERAIFHRPVGFQAMPDHKSEVGHTPSASIPESFYFGQDLPWSEDLVDVQLYVELLFWLMLDPGTVTIAYHGYRFPLLISRPHIEVFIG